METINEAKEYLEKNFAKGVFCPCCNQFVKLYKRKLNSGMAITLIRMYKHNPYGWINVKDYLRENSFRNNHDWTLLGHWGLIEENNKPPDNGGKTLGEWRITPKGREFVLNHIKVPKRVMMYNNSIYGFEGGQISIIEALGSKFNYHELMRQVFGELPFLFSHNNETE